VEFLPFFHCLSKIAFAMAKTQPDYGNEMLETNRLHYAFTIGIIT